MIKYASNCFVDFLTDHKALLAHKKQRINEAEWQRVLDLGSRMNRFFPNLYRDGRPGFSGIQKFGIKTIPKEFYL